METITSLTRLPGTTSHPSMDQLESTTSPRRILIVDDDDGVRDMLARVLGEAGYEVSCAEDGEAGWDALCAGSFDVVITDHDMPRLTGLELLRRLRAEKGDLPVILMSARFPRHNADFVRLLRPGVTLQKPFSLVSLLSNVRDFLSPPAGAGETTLVRAFEGGDGLTNN